DARDRARRLEHRHCADAVPALPAKGDLLSYCPSSPLFALLFVTRLWYSACEFCGGSPVALQYQLRLYPDSLPVPEVLPSGPPQSNAELLSSTPGKPQAEELLSRSSTLTDLARASVAELHEVPGVGSSRAAAIKAAFLLAERLSRETVPEAP